MISIMVNSRFISNNVLARFSPTDDGRRFAASQSAIFLVTYLLGCLGICSCFEEVYFISTVGPAVPWFSLLTEP